MLRNHSRELAQNAGSRICFHQQTNLSAHAVLGYKNPAGKPVRRSDTAGRGRAFLYRDYRVVVWFVGSEIDLLAAQEAIALGPMYLQVPGFYLVDPCDAGISAVL